MKNSLKKSSAMNVAGGSDLPVEKPYQ